MSGLFEGLLFQRFCLLLDKRFAKKYYLMFMLLKKNSYSISLLYSSVRDFEKFENIVVQRFGSQFDFLTIFSQYFFLLFLTLTMMLSLPPYLFG